MATLQQQSPQGDRSGWPTAVAKFILLFLIMAGLGAAAWRYNLPLSRLRDMVSAIPAGIRFAAFVGLYALVSVAPVPARDVVKVMGAILFGGIGSGFLVFLGEMLAVAATWGMSRFLGKDLVDRFMAGRLASIQKKIEGATVWQIALLRIFPGTPYRFFNYAAPLTAVKAWPYFIGCLLGTFPRTMIFQIIFGATGSALVDGGVTTFQTFMASVLFAVVALLFWAVWAAFKKKSPEKRLDA
jgi:phospholipase D1/2